MVSTAGSPRLHPADLLAFLLTSPAETVRLADLVAAGFTDDLTPLVRSLEEQGLLVITSLDYTWAYYLPREIVLLAELLKHPAGFTYSCTSPDFTTDFQALDTLRRKGLVAGIMDRRDNSMQCWLCSRAAERNHIWYITVKQAVESLQQVKGESNSDQTATITPLERDDKGKTISDAERLAKNKKIAETRKTTRERRKDMVCKTYELKINRSRMSTKALNFLIRLFLEAKWFYNYILDQPDPFNVDTRIKKVPVVTGDKIEERELLYLSGRIKQELAKRVTTAIKSLSKKKEKGTKVGRLKFKSRVTSIPLKQYGITHRFLTDKRLKIEKLSSSLRIRGHDQIPGGAEFANAHLITKHGDYFLKITVYLPKGNGSSPPEASVGIDTGLAHQFTFSSGVQVKYRIPVGNKLRKLCKKLSRQQRWSNNWYKTITKIQKEYVRIFNTKKDIRNKLASFLRANYKIICFQDESLKAWQRLWGSKMMDTSLGAFLTALRERTVTPVEVDRFFPSTQLCSNPECDHKQKMALQERIYVCPECGLVIDRDFNSSINIEIEGLAILGLVWTEPGLATAGSMPVETRSSTLMVDYFNSIPYVKASRVAEPSWKETGSHLDSIKDW